MSKKIRYKLIFEKNINEIYESTNQNNTGQGMARGFVFIFSYIAIISLFEYWYKLLIGRK